MSSFLGHTLIGFAIGSREVKGSSVNRAFTLLLFAFLAMSPDVDYLFIWILGYEIEPRYTHSLGFCLMASSVALMSIWGLTSKRLSKSFVLSIILAPLSHLVLDYFVGVHKSPFLWPLYVQSICSRFGVLPSAGKIDISNIYFWRNLIIEMAVLVPLSLYIHVSGKFDSFSLISNIFIIIIFFVGVGFGVSLSR